MSLRKLSRALGRPFERLAKKLKAKFQRSVLKTIERNPGYIQAIVQGTNPTASTNYSSSGNNMDALLMAFIRSSQREQARRSDYPRVSKCDESDVTFAAFESAQELLTRKDWLTNLLADSEKQTVLLQVAGDIVPQALREIRAKATATHRSQLYLSDEAGSHGCVCVFERRAA